MNLFLTSGCNERCSFCYADTYFEQPSKLARADALERLLEHLRAYASLVDRGLDLPPYSVDLDEETRTLFSARTVNLLGGEPTLHPHFQRVVEEIAGLGLGVLVFTNGSRPEVLQAVKEHLWTVVLNGHFAERAPTLGIEPMRIHANLPVQPGLDIEAALVKIRDAGVRTLYLAFATPAGNPQAKAYTPLDLEDMQAVQRIAVAFCRENEIFLAYDCSFPVCVDPAALQTKCSSVPVMDLEGNITICGGEYFFERGKRHVSTFESAQELHAYTYGLISRLRELPSRFDVCNGCEHFNRDCNGMCLAFREKPAGADSGGGGATDGHVRPA